MIRLAFSSLSIELEAYLLRKSCSQLIESFADHSLYGVAVQLDLDRISVPKRLHSAPTETRSGDLIACDTSKAPEWMLN